MTGSLLAIVLIPVAAAIGLVVWLVAVLRASNRPPSADPGPEPAQPVVGGIFRGDPRQQVPSRDVPASGGTTANSPAPPRREED